MKKYFILPLLLFTSYTLAQLDSLDNSYIEKLKEDVDEASKEIVSDNLELTASEAKIFWPLYDQYMSARNPIVENRIMMASEYLQNYPSMDDKTADVIINELLQSELDLLNLKKDYIGKMSEVLPATLVGKYLQIENRISTLLDLVRMSSIPLLQKKE